MKNKILYIPIGVAVGVAAMWAIGRTDKNSFSNWIALS